MNEDLAPPTPDEAAPPAAEGAVPTGDTGPAGETGQAAPVTGEPTAPADAAPAGATDASEGDVAAEGETEAGVATPWYQEMLHSGAMGYMLEGGIFMWPILLCGIVAAGVIIERFRSLKLLNVDTQKLRGEVLNMLRDDRAEEALKLCDEQQGPVPAVLATGLRKFVVLRRLDYDAANIEGQVVKAIDDYGVHIVAALERHLPILGTISSVAPMLGFLGTVQGMVVSFDDIVAKMGETNIVEAAAAGIKVALLTTVFGLVVGIPAFTAYNYFTSVINRFVLEVQETATELIEAVTLQMAVARRETETTV